jgi:xanthine dehydrogenase YagS FAD-binding subunit
MQLKGERKVRAFHYAAASDAASALSLVGTNPDATFIAGGTDILQLLQEAVIAPHSLIDINALPYAGMQIKQDEGRIGALSRLSDVADDPGVRQHFPLLAQALLETASPQVRNMATVGGNLLQRTRCLYFRDATVPCNKRWPGSGCPARDGLNRVNAIFGGSDRCIAAYPGDMAVALLALDADLLVQNVQGERRMRLADLYRLPADTPQHETTLAPGELIAAVLLPANNAAPHSHYLKVRDRASFEWPLVSVAVALEMDGRHVCQARIVAGGVGTKPWRLAQVEEALQGRSLTPDLARTAGDRAGEGAAPRAGNAFKVPMLQRAVERALLTAGGIA